LSNYFENKWFEFLELPGIKNAIDWTKKTTLPGFDGVSIYHSLTFVYREALKDDIMMRAKAMSFSFFLAIFPGIIFLLTLLPYLPFTEYYVETWKSSLSNLLPKQAEQYIFGMMDSLGLKTRVGSQIISVFLMLYFTSNGVSSMLASFSKSYRSTYKRRNYFQHKLRALEITFLLFILLILATGLVILGNTWLELLFEKLSLSSFYIITIEILRWVVVVFLFYSIISMLYRYGPSMKKKIKFMSPGAGVATFLAIVSSVGFSYYVNNFSRYNEIYGSLGAIIITMVWIEINSMALIVGYELNASIAVNRDLGLKVDTNDKDSVETPKSKQ